MHTLPGLRHALILTLALLSGAAGFAQEAPPVAPPPPADNEELARIFQEDQADRQPADGKRMDGRLMLERDSQRRARVLEIYRADGLKTGPDYFNAAFVMQHGGDTEFYLLAHEFSMAAMALGYDRAKWIAAASYDRLLKSLGRPQRFGTQYGSETFGAPMKLYQTDDGVRDSLRRALKVPPLESAKAHEAELTKRYQPLPSKPVLSLGSFAPGSVPSPDFDVLDLKSGDVAPEAINQPEPTYPVTLLPEKLTGFAIVTAVIERDGAATDIRIAKASHDAFGPATEAALRQWTFKPALKQGRPARVFVFVHFTFVPPAPGP